jgi:hypothetical protein
LAYSPLKFLLDQWHFRRQTSESCIRTLKICVVYITLLSAAARQRDEQNGGFFSIFFSRMGLSDQTQGLLCDIVKKTSVARLLVMKECCAPQFQEKSVNQISNVF